VRYIADHIHGDAMNNDADHESRQLGVPVISAVVRAGLNAVPVAGGALASLWSDWDSYRRNQRVDEMLKELVKRLSQIKEFDPNKIGPAEMQLLEDMLQRAGREHREEKRKMFAALLASNWVNTKSPFEERQLFQRALDDFNDVEIALLKSLEDAEGEGSQGATGLELCKKICGGLEDEATKFGVFLPALTKVAAVFGFVRREGIRPIGIWAGDIDPDNAVLRGKCVLLPLGQRFLASIRNEDK
jgi:hypothetical protein